MATVHHHICVCICTYKRPLLLKNLLLSLPRLESHGAFAYSAVVVDNDSNCSARNTVLEIAKTSPVSINYLVEPRRNIALARNMAVEAATGDFIAFIDDDEIPDARWLFNLYATIDQYESDGALGPVCPNYEQSPPGWVIRGRLFERPRHSTGYIMRWENSRTGNALIKRKVFTDSPDWFRPEFGSGGEDRDFFKRKIAKGYVFTWCDEARVFESVPRERWNIIVQIKRALVRGKVANISSASNPKKLYISAMAIITYGISVPFLFFSSPLIGYDHFVKYLVKFFDHLGYILALLKINPVKENYITIRKMNASE